MNFDKDAIVDELADIAVDEIEESDLLAFYKEAQKEVFDNMSVGSLLQYVIKNTSLNLDEFIE